ncbi:uncharacterized protein LOC110686908 [Chenopodium quinoa]|uniref:uncharacterized protein LOC110686908 n=1 Tax=Chenopodium quinoa TaxID=63459 RepID=UPI000B78F42A|nr:uncharacterized protein LOC110686908 [Chenopodium quinoa]XP_021719213.1 uncharacterized protein LOC110686908 [Chenopodium quinoa]
MLNSILNCGCMSFIEVIYETISDMCREIDDIMIQNARGNVRDQVQVQTTGENDKKKLAVAMKKLPLFDDDIQEDDLSVSFRRAYGRDIYGSDYEIPIRETLEESKEVQKPYRNCDRDFSHLSESAQNILKNFETEYVEDIDWEIVRLYGVHGDNIF